MTPGSDGAAGRAPSGRIALLALPLVIQCVYIGLPIPEIWPLSTFPMYSGLHTATADGIGIFGVTPDGAEIDLNDSAYWEPLDISRLRAGIEYSLGRREYHPVNLEHLSSTLAAKYEQIRACGEHAGPRITGLRLYKMTYDWSRGLTSVTKSRERLFESSHGPDRP